MKNRCKENPCCGEPHSCTLTTGTAVPVEGLVTVGYVQPNSLMWQRGEHFGAILTKDKQSSFEKAIVYKEQAEAIIAAKVEQERLRFEGELDKWMKTISAGITGYQPEAYALMDLACQELMKLRSENAALTARVKELDDECNDLVKRNNEAVATIDKWVNSCAASDEKVQALETQLAAARKALTRQTDNMAFVLTHMNTEGWYDKFTSELSEDRAALEAKP